MNIRTLKVFCDVVDTGSFSIAARLNGISQSAVSQQLAALESQFGTQLLSRGGIAAATDAGAVFHRGAKDILLRYGLLSEEILAAIETVGGTLRVGTIYSVGFYLLDPYVRAFLKAHPDVHLQVEYAQWSRIQAAIISGEMDLGVVAYPEKHRSIEIISLAKEELVAVFSPNHPLAGHRFLDPKALRGQRFVAFAAGIPSRTGIDKLLQSVRVKVDIVIEFDNIETLKRAVEVDSGLSILPRGNVEEAVADGRLACAKILSPRPWTRQIGIIRRRGQAPSKAEKMFLGLLRTEPK
ncbi:MAG: LysR family transcriptional regulator [Planctomycetota bacterium]|nr:LysR family transcriptional regulator [Planctomycetota bacterium]